jgi:hypothetical protein
MSKHFALAALLALAGAPLDEPKPGLVAEYVDTCRGLSGFPKPTDWRWPFLRRIEPKIDYPSGEGSFADSKIADHFATRWTGLVRIPAGGEWTFFTESDDGSRLFVDGKQLLDNGGAHGMQEASGAITLSKGDHPIAIDYFDQGGVGGIRFSWKGPGVDKQIVPGEALFHAKDELDRPAPPEETRLRWKLEPNQFARYRVYRIAGAGAGESFSHDPHIQVGLFAYELDDRRVYHPLNQTVREIPFIVAQTLPEKGLRTGKPVDLDLLLDRGWDYEPTRARGKIERVKSAAPGVVTCTLSAKLTGLKAKIETRQSRVKEGSLSGEFDFDPDKGAITRYRYDFTVTYEGGKPTQWIREMRLCDILTRRHATFESEVNHAIDEGVDWIWRQFDAKTDHWGAWYDHKEGPSALALLTILKGSLDRKDPRIEKALDWITTQPLTFTYGVAITMMAVEAHYSPLDPGKRFKPGEIADKEIASKITPRHKKWMEEAAGWLLSKQRDNYWAYPAGTQDFSNTQYAVLGLLSAQRCGVTIDDQPLIAAINRYLQCQERKGPVVKLSLIDDLTPGGGTTAECAVPSLGSGYREDPAGGEGVRASMALGAIGSLTILDHMLVKMSSPRYKPDLRAKVQAAVRSAWAWLAEHWSVKMNWGWGRNWQFYTLYALERAGMLGGVGTVNGHDWYWEGAVWLIANMAGDGAWCDGDFVNLHDACFAVLFLKRATVRVASGEAKK